jgi:hypothetical protein
LAALAPLLLVPPAFAVRIPQWPRQQLADGCSQLIP